MKQNEMKPRAHSELIKAWADGAEIEAFDKDDGEWVTLTTPCFWNSNSEYRIKPAAPKWPETTISEELIISAYFGGGDVRGSEEEMKAFFRIANATLAHALETGLVVLPDPERDMKIARAINNTYSFGKLNDVDMARIIEAIK